MKVNNNKPFKDISDQMTLLQSRGLIIDKPEKDFVTMNYYKVINGYKSFFLDKNATTETYKTGTKLSDIMNLYIFDMKLSKIFLGYLLEAERKISSAFTYFFTKKNGNTGYLNYESFSKQQPAQKKLDRIARLMRTASRTDENSISHYLNNYDELPLWVLIQYLQLSDIKGLFDISTDDIRIDLANHFNLSVNQLDNYFKAIYYARNKTAHNNRFFDVVDNKRLVPSSTGSFWAREIRIGATNSHSNWARKDKISGNIISGLSDVAAVIVSLKHILSPATVKGLVDEVTDLINSSDSNMLWSANVRYKMGLPKDIYKILA